MDSGSLQLGAMAIGLLGGLSIFLYGLDLVTSTLKDVAGERMQQLLARLTTNRFKGAFAGAFTTAIIQSSSVTTVLTVGFVAAGLMNLRQSVGVIMGAGIGTTITAQIIAFNITKYALIAVTAGFLAYFVSRSDRLRRHGLLVLGLGFVFFGMNLMGEATDPLRDYPPFIELLRDMDEPLLAVLVSAGFTALIQSSSATTGVIIVLASQGLITLEQGIALVFGANIGTSVTCVLASLGKSREAVQTALIHVSFNVLGVLLWFGFIDEVAQLIRVVSPAEAGLSGAERLAAETPRQIANAHTLFNVGNTLIFIWFVGAFVALVTWLVPPRPVPDRGVVSPKYLDPMLLDTSAMALDRARLELGRLAEQVLPTVEAGPRVAMHGSSDEIRMLAQRHEGIDALHDAIVGYLGELSVRKLTASDSERLQDYMSIAGYLESIGDTLARNFVHAGRERLRHHVHVSDGTNAVIERLADKVRWAVGGAAHAVAEDDPKIALEVIRAKAEINALVDNAERHLTARLVAPAPHRLETYRLETELTENLKRAYYFAKRIAKAVIVDGREPRAATAAT